MCAFAADLFDEVQQKYPGVIRRVVESFSAQHEEWLSSGQVDIALTKQYRALRVANEDVLAQSDLVLVGQELFGIDSQEIPFCGLNDIRVVIPASQNGFRIQAR